MLIHIPIVDIIEEAREAMVITLMVVIGIQDVKTTRMDATRNGTSMRDIVKKMKYKEKMLENRTSIREVVKKMKHNEKKIVDITMKKFIINVEDLYKHLTKGKENLRLI